jgi:hypothetical protein
MLLSFSSLHMADVHLMHLLQTQQGRVSTASINQGGRRRLAQSGSNSTDNSTSSYGESTHLLPPPPVLLDPATAGQKSGYFGSGPFARTLNSISKSIPASTLGVSTGNQYVITTNVAVDGEVRCDLQRRWTVPRPRFSFGSIGFTCPCSASLFMPLLAHGEVLNMLAA